MKSGQSEVISCLQGLKYIPETFNSYLYQYFKFNISRIKLINSLSSVLPLSSLFFCVLLAKNLDFFFAHFITSVNAVDLSSWNVLEFLFSPVPSHGCVPERAFICCPCLWICLHVTCDLSQSQCGFLVPLLAPYLLLHEILNLAWPPHDAGPLLPKAWHLMLPLSVVDKFLCLHLFSAPSPQMLTLDQVFCFLWGSGSRVKSSF